MSPFGLKFSQMILHTETSKLMYNWSFLFEVLHKPTLLPSTFNIIVIQCSNAIFILCREGTGGLIFVGVWKGEGRKKWRMHQNIVNTLLYAHSKHI